jgi:transposase
MAVAGAPVLSPEERAALDHEYRFSSDRLVRQRSHIVLLATQLDTQLEIARVVRCSTDTVRSTLSLYRQGGRAALRRRRAKKPGTAKRDLSWLKALALAMVDGPRAFGLDRPTWTAPLLAQSLAQRTGVDVDERTVRRGLAELGYVCRRPTWTVRHIAEEQQDYDPKEPGSKRS